MLILGNAFDGAGEFYNADWHLQSTAGQARWFPDFTPVNFIVFRFIYELLKHFVRRDMLSRRWLIPHLPCGFADRV